MKISRRELLKGGVAGLGMVGIGMSTRCASNSSRAPDDAKIPADAKGSADAGEDIGVDHLAGEDIAVDHMVDSSASTVTRLGLFVTQAELTQWQDRAVNGPYKTTGDVSTNSPGDWDRMSAEAFDFQSNPISIWTGGMSSQPSHHTSSNHVRQIMGAAFVAMVNEDVTLANNIMDWLHDQATHPSVDFTSFPTDTHPDDVFRRCEYVAALIQVYDFARIAGGGTSGQRTDIEQWFLNAGNWGLTIQFDDVGGQGYWTDRWTLDINESTAPIYDTDKTHSNGHRATGHSKRYNNRKTSGILCGALIGIIVDDASLKSRAKQWVKEWLVLAYAGDMDIMEHYRGDPSNTGNPEIGYHYSGTLLVDLLLVAEAFARIGDSELYDFNTRLGWGGTECQSGDPDKTLEGAAISYVRYANDYWERYQGSSTADNRIDGRDPRDGGSWRANRECMMAVSNKYWQNDEIKDGYLHESSAGYPPYWDPAFPYYDYGGGRSGIPTMIMFAGLENINAYPGS